MGGIDQVDVACRELLLAASSARQIQLVQEESKKTAEAEQSDKKRKAVSDHIEDLKKKKARLQSSISSLEASADMLLTKTTKHAIKYVTEANSLHLTVKKKQRKLKLLSCS